MDLEKEAMAFSMRRDRRRAVSPRRPDIDLKGVETTLKKLDEVKEGMRTEKLVTSDPKRAMAIAEALKDVNEKIADYENQKKLLTERRHARPGIG